MTMQLKTFFAQDRSGNVIPNATVRVFLANTETLASIFDIAGIAKSNPFNTGETGQVQFRVANGEYDVRIVTGEGEYTQRIEAFDFDEAEIETDSGTQIVPEAVDFRVIRGQVGAESVTTATGAQTVSEALNRRGVKFTALRAPESGEFDPEDYLETATKVTEGLDGYTLGYYEKGDGGGNDYEIVAAGTGSDDGGSFIDLAGSGLQAKGLFLNGPGANPMMYGGIGDGLKDDTLPVRACVKSGKPVYWGDSRKVWRITEEIEEELSTIISWKSDNAVILMDSLTSRPWCFSLTVEKGDHKIEGLRFEVNKKAHIGLYLHCPIENVDTMQRPSSYPNLRLADVYVSQVYRASTDFTGGDGILVRGAWNVVDIVRPHVTDISMAAGAQIPGEQGCFGVSVLRSDSASEATPYQINIVNPYINNIFSEDDTYQLDQDGIRAFTAYRGGLQGTPPNWGTEYSWSVRGGVIRNCRNRGIKGQSNLGKVSGVKFIRTPEVGGASVGQSAEINQQIGPVLVSDCEFYYESRSARAFIGMTTREEDYAQPSSQVSNVTGVLLDGAVMWEFVSASREGSTAPRHKTGVSNVEIETRAGGTLRRFATVVNDSSPGDPLQFYLALSNIFCAPDEQFIRTTGSGRVNIDMSGCHNTGSSEKSIMSEDFGNSLSMLSAVNCTGFFSRRFEDSFSGNNGPITRVDAIAPYAQGRHGLIRPFAFDLLDGEEGIIPITSATGTTGGNVIALAVSHNVLGAKNLFFASGLTLTEVNASSSWNIGSEQDPGAGSYRIWQTAGGTVVKNSSGARRQITGLIIG